MRGAAFPATVCEDPMRQKHGGPMRCGLRRRIRGNRVRMDVRLGAAQAWSEPTRGAKPSTCRHPLEQAVVMGALEGDENAIKRSVTEKRCPGRQARCMPRPFAAFLSHRGEHPAENGHGCILVRRGMSSTKCGHHVPPATQSPKVLRPQRRTTRPTFCEGAIANCFRAGAGAILDDVSGGSVAGLPARSRRWR